LISPTTRVVIQSAMPRIAQRIGAIRFIHIASGMATMRVLYLIGLETAIVFGVTSPNSSSNGTITSRLIITTLSGAYSEIRIEVMLAAAAMLTSSLPLSIEMISFLGWSSSSWMVSERGFCSLRSCCRSSREREKRAVSELEKKAEQSSRNSCSTSRTIMSGSDSSAVSNTKYSITDCQY
jgi:hypothetical protein